MKPSVPPRGAGRNSHAVLIPLLGWALFAHVYFLFAFQPGVLRSDDFGYLRSILGTLQLGHPYTYDWLAPYGAAMSSLCALLFRLTGNFYLSTWGFQAFCVLADFLLLYRLLARRLAPGAATALTLAFMTFPVCFAKAADFHGSMSTLALFLAALLFFEAGKPAGFLLAAFLAFANRQSHVVLLMLPAWFLAGAFWGRWKPERPKRWEPAYPAAGEGSPAAFSGWRAWAAYSGWRAWSGGIAFAAAAVFLHFRMNRTYAMENAVFAGAGGGRILSVTLALLFGFFAVMAIFALCGAAFRSPWKAFQENARHPAPPIAATLLLFAMTRAWPPHLLMTDTPLFGIAGWPQVNAAAPWIFIAGVWTLDYRLLRPSPYLALIGGFILIASSRGLWWDYYFIEIMAVCLLLAADATVRASVDAAPLRASWTRSGSIAVALLLAANLGYAYLLRVQMDKQKLSVTVLERLDRQGKATVDRMTGATFGYLGWKLFDYFLANEGRTYGELADFLGYVRRDRIEIETHVPWRRSFKKALPPGALLLGSGTWPIGFMILPYRVADLRGPDSSRSIMGRPMTLDPLRFRSRRFPLDNREWKVFAEQGPDQGTLSPGPHLPENP